MSSEDYSGHEKFYEYYATESRSQKTHDRFRAIQDTTLRVLKKVGARSPILDVVDIGCGAGTQCFLWAELGHHVHGLDINEQLLTLAKQRTAEAGYAIDFHVGSAVALPWPDSSMDVCLVPELLEHVAEWQVCLAEFARILRPGGVLFLTTTNKLCPVQQEFNLPFYSWYPAPLKRYFEHLAVTTRPELVNFAKYPAVNWFSFYSLRIVLESLGFQSMDRFDIMDLPTKRSIVQIMIRAVRSVPLLRFLAHVSTPNTTLVAVRGGRDLII